jgi:prophage regulatory protein
MNAHNQMRRSMHPNTPQTTTPHTAGSQPKSSASRATGTHTQPDKLIRLPAVCELTGLGKSSIYSIPDFPKRVTLSRRAVGWKLSQVVAWIESRSAVGEQPMSEHQNQATDRSLHPATAQI